MWRRYAPPQQQYYAPLNQNQYAPPSGQPHYAPPPGFPQPHNQQYGQQPVTQYPPPNQPYPSNVGPPQFQNQPQHFQPPQQHAFQYSNLSGKRKALLIGINYVGTSNALRGCHNDVHNVKQFIQQKYGYQEDDIVVLTDEPNSNQMQQPTANNIRRAMHWLVQGAAPNDALFFHYSGHGGQTEDIDGDEDDGYDETIYPVDFKQAGQIVDDEMHDILIRPLPPGCRLTAIFDSCHSGSALDLPYIYSTQGKIKEPNMLADAGKGAMTAVTDYMKGDLGGVFSSLSGVGKKLLNGDKVTQQNRVTKASNADAISWSGCKDTQTSADASEAGKATGAMSWAFIGKLGPVRFIVWL